MMEAKFEESFPKSLRKHSSIKKAVQRKVDMILDNPLAFGEPLKGNWRGFYSCPVKRNYIIIYLYCRACRKKGDNLAVDCADCSDSSDDTVKFVLLGPHDKTYAL